MEYLQFVYAVEKSLKKIVDESVTIEVQKVMKNNNTEKIGLLMSEEGYNMSPTIYLEEYYKQYQEEVPVCEIAEKVLEVYHEVKVEKKWDVAFLDDYESIRGKIVYKVIHAKRNEKMLSEVPHTHYLDLVIVCYLLWDMDGMGTGSILVNDSLLKHWDVTKETVFCDAKKNTERLLPATFKTMSQVIKDLVPIFETPREEFLYVLTNEKKYFGAACLLYEGILKEIGDQLNDNFYVIPSSIHEVLIVPESSGMKRPSLEALLNDVNETQMDVEDVLSDRVYYYVRSADRLIL